MEADALSAVLRMVRLKACVYFLRDMPRPWGIEVPKQPTGPFHMVMGGSCLLEYRGQKVRLETGDAVMFPNGAPHTMRDREDTRPVPAAEIFPALMAAPAHAPDPVATRMLCGHFERDARFDHPMFRELPEMIVVRNVFDARHAPTLGAAVTLLAQEEGTARPGASVVADRMGEVLFVQVLRAWLAEQRPRRGFLAATADPRLSRAVGHIHANGHEDIALEGLARLAGMSRTAFALRFRDAMGTTPAAYLSRWRMLQAREMLALGDLPLVVVAERVGYASEAGLIRAFKREFGQNPGMFRRGLQAEDGPPGRVAG